MNCDVKEENEIRKLSELPVSKRFFTASSSWVRVWPACDKMRGGINLNVDQLKLSVNRSTRSAALVPSIYDS